MLHVSGRTAVCSQARGLLPVNSMIKCIRLRYVHGQPHGTRRVRAISTSSSSTAAVSATAAPLLEWMQLQGCRISGVELVYESTDGRLSRELRATKDLSAGDVLLTVPLHCTIHYTEQQSHFTGDNTDSDSNGSSSSSDSSSTTTTTTTTTTTSSSSSSSSSSSTREALRRLQANVPAASDGGGRGAWQFKMALEVLYHYHQGSNSPLYPYIQTLPGVQAGIPGPQVAMLYPEPQLQELQYGPLIADAGGQIHWWKTYSREVLLKLPGTADDPFGGKLASEEQLGWALSVAMSRSFGFKRLGGWALVPLVDMANHSLVSNAEIRCDEHGMVRMIANKQVTAGSPIYLKYGNHDNANLLLSYGFVLTDNPADRFTLPLDLDIILSAIYQFVGGELPPTGRAVDGLKTWQRTTLEKLGLLEDDSAAAAAAAGSSSSSSSHEGPDVDQKLTISIGGDPPVSETLLAAVRIVLATDRSMIKGRTLQQLGDWHQPLNTSHEALVIKALVGLCTVLYKSFPTTIQADKALLAEVQQQQQQQQQSEEKQLEAERLQTAVQFRLGLKLLLEQSSKTLIMRLKELLAS